jgi:predicted aldo/keto reductase-like oxidoreductase
MKYRKLGKTGLNVSEIGLGTEHLNKKSSRMVYSVMRESIERGVNYFDIVFAFKEYRDNLGYALKGYRSKVIIAGHICCSETNGQYRLSRDVKENERLFNDLLKRLHTDYVDIVFIQMVNEIASYENITKTDGVIELAQRLKKEGKARFIGISGHKVPAVKTTIDTGHVDVLMFPINIAWDFIPGRKDILEICSKNSIGLVAMKPYAGGRIFQKRTSKYITPAQALNYILSHKAISTVVPGVKNVKELKETLRYLESSKKEKDYSTIIAESQQDLRGNCVYCNHCLPCPEGIDIGKVINKLDKVTENNIKIKTKLDLYYPGRIRLSRENFKGLSDDISKCTECGICMRRCPFEVDVIGKMKQAMKVFGK